jgi:thiol:disulfide interchange protein DsbA
MGVKPEDYKKMFNSFQVNSAIAKAKQKTQDYGIDGVPAVIVNGKYLTDVPMASSREGLWKVVNTLVNK